LDRASWHARRGDAASTRWAHRLALYRALDNPAAALLGQRNLALTLDIARTGFRIDRDQFAVNLR
jgi:hypothetical protein